MKTKIRVSQDLKRELEKLGYSEKVIQEISKWLPLEQNRVYDESIG